MERDLWRTTSPLQSNHFQFTRSPATAYDILTNDIVNHVENEEDSPLMNSPSRVIGDGISARVDFDVIHSIRDPLNAMGEEMFKPKREITRSPRNSTLTPQTRIKPALKPIASRITTSRSVRFADTELGTPMTKISPLMEETPPGMINEGEWS